MSWRESLIKLADLEIETLQKRLKAIGERRTAIELVLASLESEARVEAARARIDASAGWYMVGFREGLKQRRAKAEADLQACQLEEQGARDALTQAFEAQKKYEMLAETARLAAVRVESRREAAALDELALRRSAQAG